MKKKINLPQQHIKVDVAFYDEEQKNKLLSYPSTKLIQEVVKNGIKIPSEEFLTYYLFHRKRPRIHGYRSYQEIGRQIGKSLSDLEDFIEFNGQSIFTPSNVGEQDIKITELVGESIGMSVVNRIHNLSEADWDRIPDKGGPHAPKVFDYGVASDGTSIVQVETKGSSIDNNTYKPSAISHHKASILKKKEEISTLEKKNAYPYPASLRYGTIAVLDKREDSIVKCLLVDPEPEFIKTPPENLRLINRMKFLRDWLSFISPRSQFASALSTRVAALEVLSNPFELDNIPLLKGTGNPFEEIESPDGMGVTLNFLLNKSRVTDGPASGIVTQISDDALFFLGIRDEIAVLAVEQNFQGILKYKTFTGSVSKSVQCVLHKNRFERFKLPEWVANIASKSGDYFFFALEGALMYNQDGIVFGVLPLEG